MSAGDTVSTGNSRWDRADSWFDRASDWANAILVKETRQALKSKQFVVTFLLLLAGAWIISVFGLLNAGPSIEYGSQGRNFFYWFYLVLAVATLMIVPFGAYRSLLAERDLGTFELLNITSLSPRQIVWGKLLTALLQLFIFYSAITPFIAFASLLQGFDAPTAGYLLTATFLVSVLLCIFTLMLSTVAQGKAAQSGTSLVVLGGLSTILFSSFGIVWEILEYDRMEFDNPDFWWITLFFVLGGASYFLLFQKITTARLTFESDDRSSGIRLVATCQFLLLWICCLVSLVIWGYSSFGAREMIWAFCVMSCIHWGGIGLFAATEADFLSRRVRRDLPQRKFLRLLKLPLLPGASRGFMLVLIQMILLWWFAVFGFCATGSGGPWIIYSTSGPSGTVAPATLSELFVEVGKVLTSGPMGWSDLLQATTAMICYIIIYLGIGCALGRWAAPVLDDVKPSHVRVLLVLVITGGIITPHIMAVLEMIRLPYRGYSLFFLMEPFTTVDHVMGRGAHHGVVLYALMAMALICIVINARAMLSGMTDVMTSKLKPHD